MEEPGSENDADDGEEQEPGSDNNADVGGKVDGEEADDEVSTE
jgi:hypothetical protein